MPIQTYSSRSFTRDLGAAKRAAALGPVLITDRGRPAFALLKIEDYYALTQQQGASLLTVMDSIDGGDFEFEPPLAQVELRGVDFD